LQADELAKKTLEEFAASVKEYTAVSDLSAQIQETHDRFLKKNTALMAAFCYDPLQEAYRELRMQVNYFSLKLIILLRSKSRIHNFSHFLAFSMIRC
jgi:hypothetical protein